jgi:lipopolysaccharide/colanic/teichoic acid biosynthesis glycosyltransferase
LARSAEEHKTTVTSAKQPRLLRITTVPVSLKLLLSGQLSHYTRRGFQILAVSADGPEIVDKKIDGVPHFAIPLTRRITPVQDLVCLVKLIMLIRRFKPDIVHSHTPKAGLIGMLAAWICNVPVRMHTVAGLPLMEKKGMLRELLIRIERLTYWCATAVYPNSGGLADFITGNIGQQYPVRIIGKGSTNGIDTGFFSRNEILATTASAIRKKHGIEKDDLVYSFVGRVVRDKGIGELVSAFRKTKAALLSHQKIFLLVIGPFEQDLDPLYPEDFEFLKTDPTVILAGYQSDVRPWIMASDIFVFPSYREGFPNVVMQASCLEVPCIVSDINGCNEIIDHNRTGLIVEPKNAPALFEAMRLLSSNTDVRKNFASEARNKIVKEYDQKFVWDELEKEYWANLKSASYRSRTFFTVIVKPFFDRLVALIGLIIASPVMLICMLLLSRANKGRVWFTQTRPGKNERLFKVIKFRTMSDERDQNGVLLPDEARLHGVGKFIRRTSLDELPQLINVLKGDMSLVGPRPLLVEYLPLYDEEQRHRHDVTPGITGWAQVNGRNAISWQQKFAYDVWYVKNQTFLLDLRILLMTVLKVFKAEGINSATSVTMEKFAGPVQPKERP